VSQAQPGNFFADSIASRPREISSFTYCIQPRDSRARQPSPRALLDALDSGAAPLHEFFRTRRAAVSGFELLGGSRLPFSALQPLCTGCAMRMQRPSRRPTDSRCKIGHQLQSRLTVDTLCSRPSCPIF
jgi:hypothetical protein